MTPERWQKVDKLFEQALEKDPERRASFLDEACAGDADLRREPLGRRKKLLEKLLKGNPRLRYVDHMEREGLAMLAGALALKLEGIVAKDSQSPYVEGPRVTWHWQKVKNREYQRKEKVELRKNRR